jgi:glyoxylase-like metal-dependent hydrolase (beta-lactamase superfamily II)
MPNDQSHHSQALVHRFQLGQFEVTTILDGAQRRDGISPPFGIDQDEHVIGALAHANRLPVHAFENTFTPTLVNTGKELVLFDTGNGASRRSSGAGFLRERMNLAGYQPEDIDIIAFTHMHPDHINGVWEGDQLAFPNARYVMGQREFDAWSKGDEIPERRAENRALFLRTIPPLADNMTFLASGNDVATGIRAVEAFGHSLGHMAYIVESAGKALLIWGDVTNHYALSLQRPDWIAAMDDDRELAVKTRKRILDMVATDNLLAIGHHMPFPAVGFVEETAGAYRWLPLTYQLRV